MKLKFTILLILIFQMSACHLQQNSTLQEDYFEEIKREHPYFDYNLKKSFNGDSLYFENYKELLEEQLGRIIHTENPCHVAFEIQNETTIYRVNLIKFDLKGDKVKFFEQIGQFKTQALISFFYVEQNEVGYLLLLNKFIDNEDFVIKLLVKKMKTLNFNR